MTLLSDKAVGETILLTFDFTAALAEMGLADAGFTGNPTVSTATVVGTDTSLVVNAPGFLGLQAKMLVSGGVAGSTYEITCLATFSDGETRRLQGLLRVVS